ncbi:MAG: isochorismate synthase [Porphyromonadaceae bacterium]|nr:isochorismate synthase [Porphyromonadaceae bacterium]
MGGKSLAEELEQIIRNKAGLFAYCSPGTYIPRLFLFAPDEIQTCSSWASIPHDRGFLIAPFALSTSTPIIFLPLEDKDDLAEDYAWPRVCEAIESRPLSSEPTEGYCRAFDAFSGALASGDFEKLVLARQKRSIEEGAIDPIATFISAIRLYPDAYTYMLYTPTTGLWLGSTPELLISGERNSWQTMALAGTLPASAIDGDEGWSGKNIREQALVTSYVCDRLSSLGIYAHRGRPYTIGAGQLVHLRTDISFSTEGHSSIGELVECLHPTPAVCGLPKEEAMQFILDHEPEGRSYYSGCLGIIDPEGTTALYVNLRCLRIEDGVARLYAGGGLLPSSTLQDEWLETERKMQTMGAALRQQI